MIRKMTKYSFLLLSGETDNFLTQLQEVGLIDISRSQKPVDKETAAIYNRANEIQRLIEHIENDDYTRSSEYVSLLSERDKVQVRHNYSFPWGAFEKESIERLSKEGCELHFYTISRKKFNPAWEKEYPIAVISEMAGNVYFVLADCSGESANFPIKEIAAPEDSFSKTDAELKALDSQISDVKKKLSEEKNDIPALKAERASCIDELQKQLAKRSKTSAAEDALDILTGFAPTDDDQKVQSALDEIGVFYIAEPATKEDNPPIKLKNNWFARNFETLTGMYGMPVYDEFDPTPVLAPFFLLFWSFCMGDAAYGLILIGVGLLLRKVNILGLKPHWRLVVTLGVGATFIGLLLGTFCGVNLTEVSWIPQGLKNCMISGKISVGGSSYDVAMLAALVIGIFHICLAMTIKAIGITKRQGFKNAISTWAWLLLIVGGIVIAAGALTSVLDKEVTKWAIIVVGILSGLGIYIFNTPGRNPLVNVGAGLWATYNMATGILGDVLSYIRLYALGLAGGMLGGAFNDLGVKLLGDNPTWQWIPFALILVAGHGLNFAMSCLGAFVHPLRLTFVEYFKNSGYEGKGTKYNPLKKEEIINN